MRERTMSTPPGWPPVPPGGAYLLSALFTYHRGGGEGIVQLNDSESGQPHRRGSPINGEELGWPLVAAASRDQGQLLDRCSRQPDCARVGGLARWLRAPPQGRVDELLRLLRRVRRLLRQRQPPFNSDQNRSMINSANHSDQYFCFSFFFAR